ncbi:hypothetical protein ACS0TY_002780 [Phlomoides rotata]
MSSSNQTGASSRKSRGRQKVSMKKMEKQSNLQVTFSKRRAGLFKKASELCTLCGAEAALIVFSPAEKAYCFGHPNLKTLLDRVPTEGMDSSSTPADRRSQIVMEAHRNSTIRQLNLELTQAEGLLRAEKRRAQEIDSTSKADQMRCPSLDGFTYAQLCTLKESIMGFKNKLDAKVQKHTLTFSNNAIPPFHHLSAGGFPSATKLTLGSSGSGFYSNGGLNFGSSSLVAGEGVFNFIGGGDNAAGSLSSMVPDHVSRPNGNGGTAGFGFSLGHDRPGFF